MSVESIWSSKTQKKLMSSIMNSPNRKIMTVYFFSQVNSIIIQGSFIGLCRPYNLPDKKFAANSTYSALHQEMPFFRQSWSCISCIYTIYFFISKLPFWSHLVQFSDYNFILRNRFFVYVNTTGNFQFIPESVTVGFQKLMGTKWG